MQPGSTPSLEALFSKALEITDASARRAFLEEACRARPGLLQEITELIAAHEACGNFLESSERITVANALSWKGSPAGLESAPRLEGYCVEMKIGQGGVGAVYRARDEKLQRPVAIKVLAGTAQGARQQRILVEARRAAALRHPAIVTIYSVHDDPVTPAIVMELVEGFPVDRAAASLTFSQKAQILQEIARGLALAHQQGIIHRDIKPGNVLITPDLRPKILDFGLAISSEEGGVSRGYFEGTPSYASPEQIAGQQLSPASDVFSLGILMFKVLTGRVPFGGGTAAEVLRAISINEPPFLRDVSVGVPEELQAICLACLTTDSTARPSAAEVALDLGRFLIGEPIRLRPALYGDILRRRIAEYSNELVHWERQGMVSGDERDRLEAVHRRILADEDHWIMDARRLSPGQTALYTSTWLAVVSAGFCVWLVREELSPLLRWLAPLLGAGWLLAAGLHGSCKRDPLAAASFLTGALLCLVPAILALLGEWELLAAPPQDTEQLLESFTNAQILIACLGALACSVLAWARLRMTGFAWSTAALIAVSYMALLLNFNWLSKPPEQMALWGLPLSGLALAGLAAERVGRVRWALPFHLIAVAVLLGALDVMAAEGPTLVMLGVEARESGIFELERLRYFSFAINGYFFLGLMLLTERSPSLDLRRASRIFEPLALLHILGALFANAQLHRGDSHVNFDVLLYCASVLVLLVLAPWRGRRRMLMGALGGIALGSYLLVDLSLLPKTGFILGLGVAGLVFSTGVYVYLRLAPARSQRKPYSISQGRSKHGRT